MNVTRLTGRTAIAILSLVLSSTACDMGAGPVADANFPVPVEEGKDVADVPKEPELERVDPGAPLKGAEKDILAPISVPVKVFTSAQERIAITIQIPDALNKYKAVNDGKGPASHEEFMEHVVEANMIKLPSHYVYEFDPETQQLNVFRRK